MKKQPIAIHALLILLALTLLLAACVDTSQPWQDSSGHWHTHRVCHNVLTTTYIQVPAGRDKYGNTQYISIPHQSMQTQCTYE